MTGARSATGWRRHVPGGWWLASALAVLALVFFVRSIHPFLAHTQRVDADVLVVEGWIYDYMMAPSAAEFRRGGYTLLLTSGLVFDPATGDSFAARTAARLETQGVPRATLVPCPAAQATGARTAK